MRIDVTAEGRSVRFSKHEVKELRKASQMLTFVFQSLPGELDQAVVKGVESFVGRIGDNGKYVEEANSVF